MHTVKNLLFFYRKIKSNQAPFLINIFGLSIGLVCTLFAILFAKYETTYDAQFESDGYIYRAWAPYKDLTLGIDMDVTNLMHPDYIDILKSSLPDTSKVATLDYFQGVKLLYGNKILKENALLVDENFFELFDFNFLSGSLHSAFMNPFSAVITEDAAIKIFGKKEALGEQFSVNGSAAISVSGIIDNIPKNSHLNGYGVFFNFPVKSEVYGSKDDPKKSLANLYIKLKDKRQASYANKAINEIFPIYQNQSNQDEIIGEINLERISDIHLKEVSVSITSGLLRGNLSNRSVVYILLTMSVAILFMACINHMNTTTSQTNLRGREISIRKAMGATRSQLVSQIFFETFLCSLISLFIAVISAICFLPYFSELVGRNIGIEELYRGWVVTGLIGTFSLVIFFIGLYPSLIFFRTSPNYAFLRNAGKRGARSRSTLIFIQFLIAFIFLVITVFGWLQIRMVTHNDNLGYQPKNLYVVQPEGVSTSTISSGSIERYVQELQKHPGIKSVSLSYCGPGTYLLNSMNVALADPLDAPFQLMSYTGSVDENFFDTLGVEIVAGRGFSKSGFYDQSLSALERSQSFDTEIVENVILSGHLVRQLGFSDFSKIIGKEIIAIPSYFPTDNRSVGHRQKVIGVVKSHNFGGLEDKRSSGYLLRSGYSAAVLVRINNNFRSSVLPLLKQVWEDLNLGGIINAYAVEEKNRRTLDSLYQIVNTFIVFCVLAVLVSSMGVYSISLFQMDRKMKEVAVRKVYGASALQAMILFANSIFKPVVIAMAVAIPCGYIGVSYLRSMLPISADITAVHYALISAVMFMITLASICASAYKVAKRNPTDTLKNI